MPNSLPQFQGMSVTSVRFLSISARTRLPTMRMFSTLPIHTVVNMPALSPTMQTGSIANWLLKEGDAFSPGIAICEVETDKATVTYEATEEGYIAKILVGKGDITVGQPIMITVEDPADVKSFQNYSGSAVASSSAAPPAVAAPPPPSAPTVPLSAPQSSATPPNGRVFASPLARTLAREAKLDLSLLPPRGLASGPNGRILAADVKSAISAGVTAASSSPVVSPTAVPIPSPIVTPSAAPATPPTSTTTNINALFAVSKRTVPHYFLSMEINLSKAVAICSQLEKAGNGGQVTVQDLLVKAAAKAMAKVPDVNAAWMDTFVRKYEQVDVNVFMGAGASLRAPLLRDAGGKGLHTINKELSAAAADTTSDGQVTAGTFSIHNLGLFGVKSSAPIVLPPQACALSFGSITDTVIPTNHKDETKPKWEVAPIMVATLSCDHRVVDGAVGAAWLSAFKEYVDNPLTMLL